MDTRAIFEEDCSNTVMLGRSSVARVIWQRKMREKGSVNLNITGRQERI